MGREALQPRRDDVQQPLRGEEDDHGHCRTKSAADRRRYLTSVVAKIGQTPKEGLDQFLPDAWKAEDAAEPIETEAC